MRPRSATAALALLALVALAGCAHPSGMMRMEAVNDTALADRASEPTTGAETYPAIERGMTARRVIENGSLTLLAGRTPIETDLPYRYRGAFYDLSYEVIGTRPGAVTLARVDFNATNPNGTRLAFADLPAVDRKRLAPVFGNPPARTRPGPEAVLPLAYSRGERANSTLLDHGDERVVVTYRGKSYALELAEVKEGPLRAFRYEATRVARSTEAYVAHLKETYAFRLSGLSDAERGVVEEAIEDGYYPGGTDDEGFASLVERFRTRRAIEGGDSSGTWLVRYRGALYWTEMEFGAFVADETPTTDTPDVTPH